MLYTIYYVACDRNLITILMIQKVNKKFVPPAIGGVNVMNKFINHFPIEERGSTVRTEIIAGATTFATMAYILIIQPLYMSRDAGMNAAGVLIATALVSGVISIIMGLVSNMPFALAPGMGSNVLFASAIVGAGIVPWQTALGMVFISGSVFLILSIFGVREAIVPLIPKNVKVGIGAGLGLFIIRTAMTNSKLLVPFSGLGDFSDPSVLLAGIGMIICIVLNYLRFTFKGKTYQLRGGLLLGIIITTIIGIFMGVTKMPGSIFTQGAFSSLGEVAFKVDILGALNPKYFAFMLSFFMSDFFSTLGTSIALASKTGRTDKDGNFPEIGVVFIIDAIGTILGSLFGLSVVTTYVESASGVEVGGRTGLTSVTTGLLFLSSILFAPLFLMIPNAATAPALVLIGVSMMQGLRNVEFEPISWAPVAILMVGSLYGGTAKGIAFGLVSYIIVNLANYLFVPGDKKRKDSLPSVSTIVLAVLCCLQFFL